MGASLATSVMKYAKDVVVGDTVMIASGQGTAESATVVEITAAMELGLFNPYTKVIAEK